jgi:hypothetical protein
VVGALGAQPVGHSEGAIDVPQVERSGQGRELVDDHLGLGFGNSQRDGVGIERVCYHRPRAQTPHQVALRLAASHACHVVPVRHELGHELGSEGTGGACDKYLHDSSFRLASPPETRWHPRL